MIKIILRLREIKYKISLFLIIFFPFLALVFFGKVIFWGTASLQFIPWYQFFFDSILGGNFPLWNPFNGMGVPFIANYQSAVFYPFNWILLIFYLVGHIEGLSIAVTLLIPMHLFISSLGMMRILEVFERSKFSQFLGGIIFAFSGYILTRITFISMVWAYAWLPWIIFACIQLKPLSKHGSIPKLIQLSLFLALQLLSGHAQTTYYTILLGVFFVVFYGFVSIIFQLKKLLAFVIAFTVSILISAVQIFPTAEFLMESQRSTEVGYDFAVSLSLWPARLLTILFGNFWGNPNGGRFLSGGNFWEENMYAGVLPFTMIIILIWVLLWKTRKNQISGNHKQTITLFIAIFIFSILFSFGKFFPLFPFLYKTIPTFDLFQAPVRFLIIYFFSFSVLFGFGLDVWINSKFNHKKTIIILVVFGTLLFVSLIGKLVAPSLPEELISSVFIGSFIGLIFGAMTLIKDKSSVNKSLIKIIFGLIVIMDLLFHNLLWENFQPFTAFSNINDQPTNVESKRMFISAQDEEFLKFNVFFRPDRLQPIVDIEKIQPTYIPDTNLLNHRYAMINNFDPLQPEKFTKFWDWLNFLSNNEKKLIISMVSGNRIIGIEPNKPDFITEQIIDAKELIQWYGCAMFSKDDEMLNTLLVTEEDNSENRCVLVNEPSLVTSPNSPAENPEYLNFSIISMNAIEVNYSSENPGWVVVRQNWFPGWKAVLDGEEELVIEEVDYLFQGVFAPEGRHTIQFIYDPDSFRAGLILSISSLLLLLIWSIRYSLHRKS